MNHNNEMVKNTGIYLLGNLGTKVIAYFLTPLYTLYLLPEEYAIADLYYTMVGIAIMVMTVKVAAAMFRYAADCDNNREEILSNTFFVIICGSVTFFAAVTMISQKVQMHISVSALEILFVILALNEMIASFLKAINENKLYLLQSIVSAVALLCFSYIYLKKFHMGIIGYFYSNMCAYGIACAVVFFKGKVYHYIHLRQININMIVRLLRFSLPIIPVSLIIWLIQYSDRYIILWKLNATAAGLYAISYKIPGIVAGLVAAFNAAWGLSAIREKQNIEFYSATFDKYLKMLAFMCSGVILFTKPLASLLFQKDFFAAWRYVPWIVVAYMFNYLRDFLEYIYQVREETGKLLLDSVLGAFVNIILNFVMIKYWGVYGVIFATVISYMILFWVRYLYIVRVGSIRKNIGEIAVFGCSLIVQSVACMIDTLFSSLISLAIVMAFAYKNKSTVLEILEIFKGKRNRK